MAGATRLLVVARPAAVAAVLAVLAFTAGCTGSPSAAPPAPAVAPAAATGGPPQPGARSAGPAALVDSSPARDTTTADDDASAVVSRLGAVPIPSVRGVTDPTPTASSGRPQLLAMGAPVNVRLAGVHAVATALGPVQIGSSAPASGSAGPLRSTPAEITLTVKAATGSLSVSAADLSSRDENGTAVRLTARGPGRVTAVPGRPATLVVRGTYDNGSAQLTWRHDGAVLAVWVFTIELD